MPPTGTADVMSSLEGDGAATQSGPLDPKPISTTKPAEGLPMIESNSNEAAHHAAQTYAAAFLTDPVLHYTCASPSPHTANHLHADPSTPYTLWHLNTRQCTSNGGIITNIDGAWASAAIHFLPGTTNASIWGLLTSRLFSTLLGMAWRFGIRLSWRGSVAYPALLERFKREYFTEERWRKRDYFLVAYLATVEERRGEGLGSRWVRWLQGEAARVGKPIWLETSTERARRMYERCGFATVAVEIVGRGLVDDEGWSVAEGNEGEGHEATGVPIWAMVWWPENVAEERRVVRKAVS